MDKEYCVTYAVLEKTHWWFLARAKIITSVLVNYLPKKSLSILNIGVAGGETSRWLSQFGKVTSVENDPVFMDHLMQSGVEVVAASITHLPFPDASFDLVCAFDVVEHVEEDKVAMREMKRVCRNEGFVCITVPADRKLWSAHDVVNQHYRRYQIADFKALGAEMENLYTSYFNAILYVPIWVARAWPFRKKRSPKSDFENYKTGSLSNRMLKSIFSFEAFFIPKIKFPIGVSLIGLWKVSRQEK